MSVLNLREGGRGTGGREGGREGGRIRSSGDHSHTVVTAADLSPTISVRSGSSLVLQEQLAQGAAWSRHHISQ